MQQTKWRIPVSDVAISNSRPAGFPGLGRAGLNQINTTKPGRPGPGRIETHRPGPGRAARLGGENESFTTVKQ